jgi:hypothetical protein
MPNRRSVSLWMLCASLFPLHAGPARAEVFVQGNSILTVATAFTLGCNESHGGGGATDALALCAANGYTAGAAAHTESGASASGGSVSVFAEAGATSVGGSANRTASGNGTSTAVITWQMTTDTHYAVSSVSLPTPANASAVFEDTLGNPLATSGVLAPGFYVLRGTTMASAFAMDVNGAESVSAGPFSASADVTFADVGSPTLVLGTITVGGLGTAGLRVDALASQTVVASAITAADGTYLLPDLPGTITLRISDPTGVVPTKTSGALSPPQTFDLDLPPPSVPALAAPFAVALGAALLVAGRKACTRILA